MINAATRVFGFFAMTVVLAFSQGCSTLPPPANWPQSVAEQASADTELGRIAALSVPGDPESAQGSGFRPMPLSNYAMDARLTLVRHAQRTLDIQYYLLQNDVTGHALLRAVRDAALRGVRVRLLVDDLYTADNDRMLVAFAAYPNVEVRLFNPFPSGRSYAFSRWLFALGDFSRVNHRMHNKMFIADGAFAIAGGRNIADEYFFSSKGGNFVDFDLLVAGDAVPRMGAIFDTYWNSRRVYPLYVLSSSRKSPEQLRADFEALSADAITAFPGPPADKPDILGYLPLSTDITRPPIKLLHGSIEVFSDHPEKVSGRAEAGDDRTTVTARVGRAMTAAKSEVMVGSPYFIPGKLALAGIAEVRKRGVRVDVITNSLASNDEPFASAAYGHYRLPMLKLGVNLYEVDSSQLKLDPIIGPALGESIGRSHSKLVVIDRHVTFVGSMNLDFRSSRVNTELGLLVDSPELAEQVLALGDRVRAGSYKLRLANSHEQIEWVGTQNGAEKVYDDDPEVDLGTRLQLWLLFPFIAESLL